MRILRSRDIIKRIEQAITSWSQEKISDLNSEFNAVVGYPTELVPIIFEKETIDLMNRATAQWARASREFLKDIYKSRNNVYTQNAGLQSVIETSCYYAVELREWGIADDFPWDYSLSLDWQFARRSQAHSDIQIIEANAGSIGGLERSAFVYHAIRRQWAHLIDFEQFVDGLASLKTLLEACQVIAMHLGGRNVNFQENDQPHIFGRISDHPFREWLDQHDSCLLSNWNVRNLTYDFSSGFYLLEGQPVTNFWLQYYPVALDDTTKSYDLLGEIYKTKYERSHNISGFWSRYIKDSGYRKWHVFNPIGVDIINDKAILAHYNDIIEMYTGEKSIIPVSTYRCFIDQSLKINESLLEEVFNNRGDWVVKSRRNNREGIGVYVGRYIADSQSNSALSWEELKTKVSQAPQDYVCQNFLEEPEVSIRDGGVRSYEVRNFAWTCGNSVTTFDLPYVRSSEKGTLRNLSRKAGASIIPVMIAK